ncbi:unnamed protein product [Sphagnum tenellum]
MIMLTSEGHYAADDSASRTINAAAIVDMLQSIKEKFGYLAVVFTKDMQMHDVQYVLAKENFDLLILPYTAEELRREEQARKVSNSLIHHALTFNYITTNLDLPRCWHDHLEHYRWVNPFWRMHASTDFVNMTVEYKANLTRIRTLCKEMEEFICMLVRLTQEKRLQLTDDERDAIIFNISRFAKKFEREESPFVVISDDRQGYGQGQEAQGKVPSSAFVEGRVSGQEAQGSVPNDALVEEEEPQYGNPQKDDFARDGDSA